MQFFSTRDHNRVVSASQAIAQGLSDEGGLFVPQSFPQVDVKAICALDYPEMAAAIVGQYLTDYSQEFLQEAAKATYGAAFGGKAGYLASVSDEVYSLELWHGPTCAFKDYALQLMPKLLVEAKKNLDRTEKTLILVATSGDTGIYQEQTVSRDELKAVSKNEFESIVNMIASNEHTDPQLEELIRKLYIQLQNVKGKKVYGYLPMEIKETVNKIFSELAKDENIQQLYEKWCGLERLKYKTYTLKETELPELSANKVFQPVRNMATLPSMARRISPAV